MGVRRKLAHDTIDARRRVKRIQAVTSIALGIVCGFWLRFMSVHRNLVYQTIDNYDDDADNGMMMRKRRRRMGSIQAPTIDILSIGSAARPHYLQAQLETFASHPTIRAFYPITEVNDTDSTCSQKLTTEQYDRVVQYCNVSTNISSKVNPMLNVMNFLFDPTHPDRAGHGWLCAQKRPVEAVVQLLRKYKTIGNVPDYLIILDDDSYIANMESLQQLLLTYPSHMPSAVAACPFDISGFVFPWGGHGSFWTRTAMRNFMHPIDCTKSGQRYDRRSKLTCAQLERNLMGEKRFFHNNMSVADLMYEYSMQQPFTKVFNWQGVGYCMHSDHALAYFINFYLISLPDYGRVKRRRRRQPLQTIHGYVSLKPKQCHKKLECSRNHTFCHYMTPEMMYPLYTERYEHRFSYPKWTGSNQSAVALAQ
jgi:hypothetical protein